MLQPSLHLNPAVRDAADLMTDRVVTDALLWDVAAMKGLPLFVEAGSAIDRTAAVERELVGTTSNARITASLYRAACRCLGFANAAAPVDRRAAQRKAMGALNKARAEMRKAEKRLTAARAALAALAS
ncbi:hypothetical protein [Muricoccus radiodurans]|uniref:hypothetical protein n=1 Tax=Muricoccus radiodurans TaxID=2231721 RepID=UPI003CF8BB2A